MQKARLGNQLKRVIAEKNPHIGESMVFAHIPHRTAITQTALALTDGQFGNDWEKLSYMVEDVTSAENFIQRLLTWTFEIPSADEFFTSWRRRKAEQRELNEQITERRKGTAE